MATICPHENEIVTCPACDGVGWFDVPLNDRDRDPGASRVEDCETCTGIGRVRAADLVEEVD